MNLHNRFLQLNLQFDLMGQNVVVSRFESAQGTFQIFGDNEVRSGTLEKRWLKAGLNLGAQYALAKP
jgi:hypothetical protein